ELVELTKGFQHLQSRVKDLEDGHPPRSLPSAPIHAPLPFESG
ncbi:9788_t:CDS:1, partial [Rhizophagus irregularis]